jgi:hypothetical protein
MSVVDTADLGVWFAADRFDRLPFLLNLLLWSVLSLAAIAFMSGAGRAAGGRTPVPQWGVRPISTPVLSCSAKRSTKSALARL